MKKGCNETVMFHVISANAEKEEAQQLLEGNPELINARGLSNATALHWVCLQGTTRSIELEGGVFYSNLLNYNRNEDYVSMIKLLHSHGADINAKMNGEITPLHLAAAYGTPEVAKVLIDLGSSVLEKDSEGKTPIDYAINNKKTEIAEYLLSVISKENAEQYVSKVKEIEKKENKVYSDNIIEFTYSCDFDLIEANAQNGNYSLTSFDEKYFISIKILTEEIKDVYTKLLEDDTSRGRQKRTVTRNIQFGDNYGDVQCLMDYHKDGCLFSKCYHVLIHNKVFIRIMSISDNVDFELDAFKEFIESIHLKHDI